MSRSAPMLPRFFNLMIFLAQDGKLEEWGRSLAKEYFALPWWRWWRRWHLERQLFFTTALLEAYHAGEKNARKRTDAGR